MKFKLVLFQEGDSPADVKATVICAHNSREAIDEFIERGKSGPSTAPGGYVIPRAGRKGRAVRIIHVAEDSMVSVVRAGDVFPSAQAATDMLKAGGVQTNYNLVLVKLAEVKSKPIEDRIADIEGVKVQYQDDFEEEVLSHAHID